MITCLMALWYEMQKAKAPGDGFNRRGLVIFKLLADRLFRLSLQPWN
jgi:hypothetical protein